MRQNLHYHMPIPVQCAVAFGASAAGVGAAIIGHSGASLIFDSMRPLYEFPVFTEHLIGLGFFVVTSDEVSDQIAWRTSRFCRIKYTPR